MQLRFAKNLGQSPCLKPLKVLRLQVWATMTGFTGAWVESPDPGGRGRRITVSMRQA